MNQLPPLLRRDADAPRRTSGQDRRQRTQKPDAVLVSSKRSRSRNARAPSRIIAVRFRDLMPLAHRVDPRASARSTSMRAHPTKLRIEFDPYRAAELGIRSLRSRGVAGSADDVSGGFAELGRRQYTLRFAGRYRPDRPRRARARLARRPAGAPRRRRHDLVERGDRNSLAVQNNNPAIGDPDPEGIRRRRAGDAERGQERDREAARAARSRTSALRSSSRSIRRCSSTRRSGWSPATCFAACILAVGVLWLFLRQFRSTLLVGIAIPVSVLATVLIMLVTGHTLNVISIAGHRLRGRHDARRRDHRARASCSRRERGASPRTRRRSRARSRSGRRSSPRRSPRSSCSCPSIFMQERRGAAVRGPRAHDLGRDRRLAHRSR